MLRGVTIVVLETFRHRKLDGALCRGVVLLGIAKARLEGFAQAGVTKALRGAVVLRAGNMRHGKRQRQSPLDLIVHATLLEVRHGKHSRFSEIVRLYSWCTTQRGYRLRHSSLVRREACSGFPRLQRKSRGHAGRRRGRAKPNARVMVSAQPQPLLQLPLG